MAILGTKYNAENTLKTETRSVEQTSVSKTHKIIKSTDNDIPSEVSFVDENGDLITGVWEVEGVHYAMALVFETTLDDIKGSRIDQFESTARSEIGEIDVLKTYVDDPKQAIIDKLVSKKCEVSEMLTIQEVENVHW